VLAVVVVVLEVVGCVDGRSDGVEGVWSWCG
jgi:hypothetical protein